MTYTKIPKQSLQYLSRGISDLGRKRKPDFLNRDQTAGLIGKVKKKI
jgi:hypothetical protein